MNRIQEKFKELKQKNEKALVTFVTAGDPSLASTEKIVLSLEKAGADLIELGVPFSDPMADGPVIQRSSDRALKHQVGLKDILGLVKKLRQKTQIPIILMGYYNPILRFGVESFCHRAGQAGVDGLIVVDLPPEESQELHRPARKNGLNLIYLLTPTADKSRIRLVQQKASGFVYYVSVTGITGSRLQALKEIQTHVRQIKQSISLPVCIGFGIRNAEDAKNLSLAADGVVVGSVLVSLLEKKKGNGAIQALGTEVKKLKRALILS